MKPLRASSIGLLCGLALTLAFAVLPASISAADTPPIVGDWNGTLDPGAQPKRQVVVHIAMGQDSTLSGTIDFPDQETSGIQITAITYKAPALHFESTPNLSSYDGTMNRANSEIMGTWTQGGAPLSLLLKRVP